MRIFRVTYFKNGTEVKETFKAHGWQILEELEERFPDIDLKDLTVREVTSEFMKSVDWRIE